MPNWTDEQLEAINKDGSNIIVSAGAGSGKTTVLSERVLRKVKSGTKVDSLLILTFTNAASHEMKEKIRENLIENNLIKEASLVDNAYITTFDSYALSIVKKYHYLLNINKDISICDSSLINVKRKEIMDNIFIDMYKNEKFRNLIDDFCLKDDNEIKESILKINEKLDMIYDKKSYLDEYLSTIYNDNYINSNIDKYLNLIKDKVKLFIELVSYLDINYKEKYNEIIEGLNKEYDKMYFLKIPSLPKNSDLETTKIKKIIEKLYKELTNMHTYNNVVEIKNSILETKKYVEVIIDIINKFDFEFNKYKREFDLYEFIDIAKLAITLVKENEVVRNELSYSEILIDEYQDTNDLQDTFISYIENNNVYMVGDIKQSIYRFRNANPLLFKTKYENYSNNLGGIKIDLNKNFRSRKEVVTNINDMFNLIMDKFMGGADYVNSHQMIFGNDNYIKKGKLEYSSDMEILTYDEVNGYSKEEIEIFTIISSIKEKMKTMKVFDKKIDGLRNIKYSDFAILIDRGSKFDLYKKIFEYSGIPLTVYKDEKLNDSIELFLIKNIICFLTTKDINLKKHSFMSILRSYLFNIDDNTIFNYVINNDYSYLDNYLINTTNLTPYELTEYIIDKFNFYDNMIKIGDIKSREQVLSYLLDFSLSLTNMGYDIESYSNFLEQILEDDIRYEKVISKNDSVKIMTIHKSKGLEFPVCYYSSLFNRFNIRELNDKIYYDKEIGIITPLIDHGIRNTIYKELVSDNYYKEEISEKIRLFYVALTRAKEKIIMVLPNKEVDEIKLDYSVKMSYRSISDMIYSIYDKIKSFIKYINLDNINLTHDYNLIKQTNYKNDIKLVDEKILISSLFIENELIEENKYSKNINKIFSEDEYKKIEFGKHMHSIFENIDFTNPDYKGLSNIEKEKVEKFLNHDIFDNVKNIHKEYEFIYEEDNNIFHGVIDLLLEYDNMYKIIDYKLKNIVDDSYTKQLEGYKNYIEKLTGKSVKIYLYSIIDDNLMEL